MKRERVISRHEYNFQNTQSHEREIEENPNSHLHRTKGQTCNRENNEMISLDEISKNHSIPIIFY